MVKNAGIICNLRQSFCGDAEMENPAELFEAISHPTRIKILKILDNEPSTFASMKRELGIDSSGNLDHHLKKLGELIKMQQDGLYGLTDTGKEALASVGAVESWKETERRKIKKHDKMPKNVAYLLALEVLVAVSAVLLLRLCYVSVISLIVISIPVVLLSLFGIIKQKTWGWSLTVAQTIFFIGFSVFTICSIAVILNDINTVPDIPQYLIEQFPELNYRPPVYPYILGAVGSALFGALQGLVLFVANKQNVKEFFGMQQVTSHHKRVLAAGLLIMFFGILVVYSTTVFRYPVGLIPQLNGLSGLLILFAGVAILMEKYTIGGLVTIAFCFLPIPSFLAIFAAVFSHEIMGILPFSPFTSLMLMISVSAIPAVALLLVRSNIKQAFSQMWRQLGR